jgi:hypothetical protein
MSLNQICSNSGANTFSPSVSLRELNLTNNLNFGSDAVISEPSAGVIQVKSNELKWQSVDSKDHFRCYADGQFSHFEFTGDDIGGILCDFKVPSSESPYDIRIAVGNPSGNFILNKGLLLFQDSTGTLAGQELLIRDSAQPGGSGIALPNTTVGYVASTLNYYEENAFNASSSGARVVNTPFTISRVGKSVTFNIGGISTAVAGGASTISFAAATVPARFRPTEACSFLVRVVDNASATTGLLSLALDGSVVIGVGASGGAFTNAANCGYDKLSVAYSVV